MRLGHFETALLDMGDRWPHPAIIRRVGFPKQTGCSRRTVKSMSVVIGTDAIQPQSQAAVMSSRNG